MKDEKSQEMTTPKPQQGAKPEEKPSQKDKPEVKKDEIKKAGKPAKKERPTECSLCNKSIKKLWYYRDGNYYCGKRCWKKAEKKRQEETKKTKKKSEINTVP